jgi:hypothetical protein
MALIKILAAGETAGARANARGHLFEALMARVLRHYGYEVDRTPNVNYSGMEIDIEGRQLATGTPLYAECKAYETAVDSPKMQAFFGKYIAQWRKDQRSVGLFVALPGVNSHAKGFYRDNCKGQTDITVRLLEEQAVAEALWSNGLAPRPDVIQRQIQEDMGRSGDWNILYTEHGVYWVQYLIPPGAGIASSVMLFDSHGRPITDKGTTELLVQLDPALHDFDVVTVFPNASVGRATTAAIDEEIVEVRGSSSCFEYQFPASPEFLVGRGNVLGAVEGIVEEILAGVTSRRGLLFEANSGWGKSSVVLAAVDLLTKAGHYAVAIDSRSASSTQFMLRTVDYCLRKFRDSLPTPPMKLAMSGITGFEGALESLVQTGRLLEKEQRLLFIFLDQFENVFLLPDTLSSIRNSFLRVCDAQTNVVMGFSWKTDLIGLTNDFPYQMRDDIVGSSKRIPLPTFSEQETNALLERLRQELRAPLRKDLAFFLSEFSQGYPWLLKKLCAHVKSLRESGTSQAEIATRPCLQRGDSLGA